MHTPTHLHTNVENPPPTPFERTQRCVWNATHHLPICDGARGGAAFCGADTVVLEKLMKKLATLREDGLIKHIGQCVSCSMGCNAHECYNGRVWSRSVKVHFRSLHLDGCRGFYLHSKAAHYVGQQLPHADGMLWWASCLNHGTTHSHTPHTCTHTHAHRPVQRNCPSDQGKPHPSQAELR